jgi:hypothetical protein
VIAKNASTTLKQLVYSLDYPDRKPPADTDAIHDAFGYRLDNKTRISLKDASQPSFADYTKFAVFREPADRLLSVYYDKVSPNRAPGKPVRKYFFQQEILDSDIDAFLSFTERELGKPDSLQQDEHLRRQASFYSASSVDHIVPLRLLHSFLDQHLGLGVEIFSNTSARPPVFLTKHQEGVIKALYHTDYKLLECANVYHVQN